MTAVNLESRLDDTGQMMTELSSRFESPAVSRGPGTPGSSARIERINLDIALYTERLDDTLNSHPESLRALCKEVLGQYGDTKHELSELTSKFQQQQKELDNATRMLRQQQSLVSAGLVAKRPQQQHPEIALMTRLIQEMEGVIEHVKSTHTVSTLPQDFVKVHRKLGEVDTLDFAESVLNVRCRLATLLDDVIRPCSVKHAAGASPMPPSPSRRELSMQKEKIAASHSTLLAVMGKFGLVGRVVSSEASVDEGIDKTMLDSERLLTAVEDNLASALKRLGRIVANIVPFPAPLSSASSFIDYIANCSSHLEDFSSKSLKDLSEMTSAFGFDSAVHAASPTVISLITRAKQISLSKMPQNPQEATSTRMKHILNLSGSILELVSPEDADRMKDRDIEAVLRTAVVHIEAACGREAKVQSELQEAKQLLAEATAARQTETRRIAHIGDILSEIILDPSKLSLRDASGELSEIEIKLPKTDTLSVEEKLSELHLLYQEKRDKNFELEAELDACNVALNRFFGEFDREFDFISTEPLKLKLDTLPKVLALSRKRGNNHDTNTSDDEAILHQSEGTMHKIYAMLRAGDKQWGSGQVDLNSVEAAVEGLTQRVRSAERRAAELETHSRRIMSKIQNIISSYDYRSPAKRHVHIGDDIDEDSDDFSSGALHDLEALLQTLVKGGNKDASYRIERDYVLDNVEENLRVILPHVESLVGVPAGADRGVDLMVTPSDDSLSRLTVTMSRWKRALDHFKMSQPSSGYGGEKVLLRTVQHFTSRLRAALSCQDLPGDIGEGSRPPSTFQSIEGDSLEVAVNELDHYTTAASAVVEKYGGERTRVLATLQTIIAAAAEVGKMKGPKEGESEVHAVSQMAAACVADLVGRYSGTHTRLQRLSSAVLSSAAAVDKIMPSKNEARSMSLSRRNEDVPEFVLQESITRLTARVGGKVRTPEQLETPGSPQSVPEGTVEQLRFLASQAPAGSSLDDLVSCVGERLAAFESDRAVQKKEGERARTAWRKLHDEVTRRLAPLLDILEDKASRSRTPPPREQEDEGKKAFNTIWRLEERVMALNRQHQVLTQDHAGERSRRIDLEQRLKSIKKQYAKTSKELVRMCVVTEVTAVPVADELSSDIDIEATSRSLYEAVVTLSETAGQVSQMREQVMTSSTDAEESKAHAAKTDMRHLHLLNAVTDVLSVLGLMPSAPCDGDNTWDAVVSGVSKLLSEVREGREARTRVQSLEIMMETLLSEVQGVPSKGAMEVPETRFSLSPLTAASIGSPPRRQPPPSPPTESPAPHTDDFKADADKMEAFRQRCTQVVDTFRTTLQSAENEKTLEADLQEAHTALQRIQATLLGQETPSHQANRQDPGVTADNVSERVQHLIEVSAASAAEKAKLIRQNLELKQDLEKAQDDVAGVREDLQDANESRGHLKRKLESANMFVSYAKEMMDDADNAAGRETDPSGDEDEEDEFKEVIAVRAYQSYLTVRKDNETLTRKLEEAEGEIEELQLQEDFFGGISAKVIALDSVCTDALGKLRQDTPSEVSSSPTSSRAPSRTPPVKPDGSPTTILNHIATMSNTLSNIKSESAALQKALQELVHSVDAISSAVGAGVSPPQSQDVLTTAAYLRSALLHLQGLIEEKVDANRSSLDTIKDMEEQRRTLLREKEGLQQQVNHQQEQLSVKQALQPRMEPPSRPPPPPDVHLSSTMPQYHPRDEYQGDRGSTLSDRHMFDLHAQPQRQQQRFMDEAVSEALSHDFAHNRHHPNMSTTSVSPQRAKGGDPRELYEIERAMFSITNKLEELVGKVPVVSESPVPTLPDIAWHLDTLCTNIVTELSYLAHKVLPGQPILDAVKSKYAAQAYSSAPEQSMERVKAHIAQLLQLGNAIASAPPRECTRMLLKSTKSGEDEDSIGLVACTRRLHVIVANKLDAAPREIKELKARSELLEAQVRSMEIEGDKRSTSLRNSTGAERKASQLLSMQKEKFEAQKRLLEERLSRAEGARDSVQEQLDAAQSNLALSRNRNAGDVGARSVSRVVSPHSSVQRHPSRSPSNQQREQQHQQQQHHGVPAAVVAAVEKENDTLKSQLQDTNTQYDEMRHAAEKLSEKLEEKEVARKDYKDKYRQALDEIEALEDEKESLKKGFAAQLTSVKEQLVKLQVQKGSRAKSASSDPQSRRTATPSSIPRDINRDSITVPQEFNLHKSKGRTGCWVCDNPDGPTKYGGTAPPHQCTAKRRRRDASPLAS